MKFCKLLSLTLILLLFNSCSSHKSENSEVQVDDKKLVEDTANEIVRCFDEKDVKGLSKLFNQYSHDSYDLEATIKKAFEVYEGHSDSFTVNDFQPVGSMQNFEYVDKYYLPYIMDKMDTGKRYLIRFTLYEEYKEHPEVIGVQEIRLIDFTKGQKKEMIASIGVNYE